MDGHIEITESDLGYDESKLRQIADRRGTTLDRDRRTFVVFGVPIDQRRRLVLPDQPHVFIVDELEIVDKTHPQGVVLKDVPVVLAHGYRDTNDRWKFANHQPVVDTVDAYDNYAKRNNMPPLEFVLACNSDPVTESTGVRISDLGINSITGHAVGEVMGAGGGFDRERKFKVRVVARDNFMYLDRLITYKQIEILG